jgi:hypothetical protein
MQERDFKAEIEDAATIPHSCAKLPTKFRPQVVRVFL